MVFEVFGSKIDKSLPESARGALIPCFGLVVVSFSHNRVEVVLYLEFDLKK